MPRAFTPMRKTRRGRGCRITDMEIPLSSGGEVPARTSSVGRLGADAVFLQLAVEAGPVDPENRRRQLLVPVAFRQGLQDVEPLVFIEGELHVAAIFHRLSDAGG